MLPKKNIIPMKILPSFLLLFSLSLISSAEIEENTILTPAEAQAQVESKMALKKSREIRRRMDLLAVPAESESVKALKNGGSMTIRRIAAPARPATQKAKEAASRPPLTEEEIRKFLAEAKPPKSLSVSVTVYDKRVSKIRIWHEGETYEVLSNVPFSHLQGLGSFETDEAKWSVIAMVGEVNKEDEQRMAEEAKRFGSTYRPRKRPDISLFNSMEEPEYLVFPGRGETVPDGVFAKLDALHVYYLENEEKLAREHHRRDVMAEAHRRYRQANPPEPQEIVINFWRVE